MRVPSSLLLPALILLAGCTIGDTTVRIPVAGGETVPINFSKKGPSHAETGEIKIEKAVFDVGDGKNKAGKYEFAFLEKEGDVPRQVKVDDITEDPVVPWVEDNHPKLTDGRWQWTCRPTSFYNAKMEWLHQIESSIRIYRFTIVNSDGSTTVLYEAGTYPPFVKEFVRSSLEGPAGTPDKPMANPPTP